MGGGEETGFTWDRVGLMVEGENGGGKGAGCALAFGTRDMDDI